MTQTNYPTRVPPGGTQVAPLRLRHTVPAFRVFGGSDALAAVPRELGRLGSTRTVVVTSPSMAAHTTPFGAVQATIGERLAGTFATVAPHSPVPVVRELVDLLRSVDADSVIAVGGGSAVVTARAAIILYGEQRAAEQRGSDVPHVTDLCTHRDSTGRLVSPRMTAPKLPMWVVPSTPTTAYAKAGAAVHEPDTGKRLALFDPAARAQGIFIDPEVALTAPPELVLSSSLNVLTGAAESSLANDRDPLADAPLSQALTMVSRWLPQHHDRPDDAEVRMRLMLAALLCGQGTDHVGGGLAQALAHAVGPRSTVANGFVEAILLPQAIRFAGITDSDRLERMASALGTEPRQRPDVNAVAELIEEKLAALAVPARLRDVGVDERVLPVAAAHAMDDWAITQVPRRPTRDEVEQLLRNAW